MIQGVQTLDCTKYFGYLSERSNGEEIPEECIVCLSSTRCMLRGLETDAIEFEETDKDHSKEVGVNRYGAILQHQHLPPLESLLTSSRSICRNPATHSATRHRVPFGRNLARWRWIKL